jgi:dihydropteroate synthase
MFKIPAQDRIWEIEGPQIMGILNVTVDSFYEASRVKSVELALNLAEKYINEGAQIIDIGGQSSRPGAQMIEPTDELKNLIPIVEAIRIKFPSILISIDTFQSKVAAAALAAGANIINDISCSSFDENLLEVVATYKAGYIGMHLTGNFQTMHSVPKRENIINDQIEFFEEKKKSLAVYGIEQWVIDPGFGFGKTIEENFTIVKEIAQLKALDLPILLGVSRKSSIYKTLNITPEEALNGTTVLHTFGILNGASILRVHDVKEANEVITLLAKCK